MGRKPFKTPDEKLAIVLSVLKGETTQVEVARRLGMSQTTVAKWQKQFLEGEPRPWRQRPDPRLETRDGTRGAGRGPDIRPGGSLRGTPRVAERGGALPSYEELEQLRSEGGIPVRRFLDRFEDPAFHLVPLAGGPPARSNGPALASPDRRRDRGEGGRAGAPLVSMGPSQDLGDAARGRPAGVAQLGPAGAREAEPAAARPLPGRAAPLAVARRALFVEAPTRRNRVWQTDFTEYETSRGGTWRLSPVVDYATKLCLAVPVSGTTGARDAIGAVEAAIDAAEWLMSHSLLEDCVDRETGELFPLTIVTDNGQAYKS